MKIISSGRFDVWVDDTFRLHIAEHLRIALFDYLMKDWEWEPSPDQRLTIDSFKNWDEEGAGVGYSFYVRDLPYEIYEQICSLYMWDDAPYARMVGGQFVTKRIDE
jgi:hypothetical protein